MKSKKVLAALLAALTLTMTATMSGCSKKANNEESEKSGIVTLNMFVLTEEETSAVAARDVQMAINEITVPQHKMLVKINYLTKDEYWDTIDKAEEDTVKYVAEAKKLAEEKKKAEEAAKKAGKKTNKKAEQEDTEKPKTIGEMSFNQAIDYVFEIDDVTLDKPQIDILVVDDFEKFGELVEDGRVAEIDIKYDRKALTKYIHPTILTTCAVGGRTYGIPVNFAMDAEYEFLVYNKNLLDKYGYSVHDLRKIENMGEYLALIKANEPGFYPISDIPELAGAEIYDDVMFTLSGLNEVSQTSFPVYLNNAAYSDYLKKVASYRENGYVAAYDGVENAKYAIEFVTADSLIEREWTDEDGTVYQSYLYDIPRVASTDAFKSAMCVSAYSVNKAEAAELIELFNTDSELANLLQYGIEGRHYRAEDGIVTYIGTEESDVYRMDNFLTGNTYIKYVEEENADYVERAKNTNLSVAPSAFFGYTPALDDVNSKSIYDCVKGFSTEALEMIANGEITVDDAFNIANKQLVAMGCRWNQSGSALEGVFGTLGAQQSTSAQKNTSYFVLSEAAKTYNDVYKSVADIEAEKAAEEAAKAAEKAQKAAEEAAKAAEKAQKAADEEAALQAQIDAENAKNEEPKELTEEEIIAALEAQK